MTTKLINLDFPIDEALLDAPAECLKNGGLVVFPTETVYGLGANALSAESVRQIFVAKGRPSDNPLIVHIADAAQLADIVSEIPQSAKLVMEALWPGPVTLIMRKSDVVPGCVTAGLDTVAVRMPSHPAARALLRKCGVPVAAPSANTSGRPSPTTAQHVVEDLSGKVDYIIDGGNCTVGLESTVLDVTVPIPQILRPGGVGLEELKQLLGEVCYDRGLVSADTAPKSPGMKYKHYAPRAQMAIVEGTRIRETIASLLAQYHAEGKKTGVLTCGSHEYDADFLIDGGVTPELYAQNLFGALREFDARGMEIILAEMPFGSCGIEPAIRNRITKAAGGNVIRC